MKAKVQTNDYKVNILVETQESNNRHYSSHNKDVELVKVLSDEEIIEVWKAKRDENPLEQAREWIKKQEGYAVSNCVDKTLGIDYSSVVEYK